MVDAAKPATAPKPAAKKEGAEKYSTMIVGIGKSREELHKQLEATADKLGVKNGHLVWHAIEQMLKAPPKTAAELNIPATARVGGIASVGSAPGFWVVPVNDAAGKAVGVKVTEVLKRPDIVGREFYRFTAGETEAETVKNRERAKNQAIRGAKSDLAFLGIKDGTVKVEELAKKA